MRPPSGNALTRFATGIAAVAAADRRLQPPRVQFGRGGAPAASHRQRVRLPGHEWVRPQAFAGLFPVRAYLPLIASFTTRRNQGLCRIA